MLYKDVNLRLDGRFRVLDVIYNVFTFSLGKVLKISGSIKCHNLKPMSLEKLRPSDVTSASSTSTSSTSTSSSVGQIFMRENGREATYF